MTARRIIFLSCYCIAAIQLLSCTKDIDLPVAHLNTVTNIQITIYPFYTEPYSSSTYWRREIFVYDSFSEFINKINPEFHVYTYGNRLNTSVIMLDSLNCDALYLRVTLWENDSKRDSFYYNDSIMIPAFHCDMDIITIKEKWILGN